MNAKAAATTAMIPTTEMTASRFCLYLPRNLSHCSSCSDVLELHMRRKMKLIERQLLINLSQTCATFLKPTNNYCSLRKFPLRPKISSENSCDNYSDEEDVFSEPPHPCILSNKKPLRKTADSLKQQRSTVMPLKPKSKSSPSSPTSSPSTSSKESRRKMVRFADSLGLNLESIKNVFRTDLPPVVPSTAFDYLHPERLCLIRRLIPSFADPIDRYGGGIRSNLVRQVVKVQKVVLERTSVVGTTVNGVVLVDNLAYEKKVSIRYTTDGWTSFSDLEANFGDHDDAANVDSFTFGIFVDVKPSSTSSTSSSRVSSTSPILQGRVGKGDKVNFVIRYRVGGQEFWDNNGGKNYGFDFFCEMVPQTTSRSWVHFL